jgi:hypothetical protein
MRDALEKHGVVFQPPVRVKGSHCDA